MGAARPEVERVNVAVAQGLVRVLRVLEQVRAALGTVVKHAVATAPAAEALLDRRAIRAAAEQHQQRVVHVAWGAR